MRIEIIERKLYKFEELSEDIKNKVIENQWNLNIDYEWWDSMYEDAERIGLKITEFDLDRGSYAKGKFINNAIDAANKIIIEHGENCETYKTAESYLAEREKLIAAEKAIWDKEENEEDFDPDYDVDYDDINRDFLYSLLEDYRIMLRKNYDFLTGREAIIETIEANEYEFTENGDLA